MKHAFKLLMVSLLFAAGSASAENWPHWRGPNFNGSSPETGLPETWSKTENIAWTLDLPGPGAATPVVWQDRVFVSTTDQANQSLHALCIDRNTGKILWQQRVADGYRQDDRSNYASPSPVTDGERVFFFYGNGELAAFDLAGDKLWQRNLQKDHGDFAFLWTFSTSPTLYKGKLYMQILQRDAPARRRGPRPEKPIESFLLALNPANGEALWKVNRPSEAVAESREAFTTPIPHTFEGRDEILIAGGDDLTGHDPATGEELWRWGTWNPTRIGHWRLVPSPVAGGGVILACAPKRDPIYAIKAGGKGRLDDSWIAWKSDEPEERVVSSDVPTPAFYDNDFIVLSDVRKAVSRVSPKTGEIKWSTELPGFAKFESSPAVADGKIYLMNFKGDVVVVGADDGKIRQTIPMGEDGDDQIRSSIAVSGGQLFIRTNSKLFCVGGKSSLRASR